MRRSASQGVRSTGSPGGRGLTWRAGPVVSCGRTTARRRPAGGPTSLASLEHTAGFRTPRPVATPTAPGAPAPGKRGSGCPAAPTSAASPTSSAPVPRSTGRRAPDRPSFLDDKDNAWSRADRMAWDEVELPHDPTLDRLAAAFRPVRAPRQLIHGDLLGNVLFADGQPPTVIDWPPYWRPAGFGAAVAAVDAVCWHGVPMTASMRSATAWPSGAAARPGARVPDRHHCTCSAHGTRRPSRRTVRWWTRWSDGPETRCVPDPGLPSGLSSGVAASVPRDAAVTTSRLRVRRRLVTTAASRHDGGVSSPSRRPGGPVRVRHAASSPRVLGTLVTS